MSTQALSLADVIARNREKLRYSGPLRVTREDCAALLDAAEELERVKTSNSAVFDLAAYIKDGIAKQEEEQARMFGISKVEATK